MSKIDKLLAVVHAAVKQNDRKLLAALRHGFGENTQTQAWSYLAAYCDLTDNRQLTIWRLVAGTAAILAPDDLLTVKNAGNFGATMRELATGELKGKRNTEDALATFDKRFRRLLVCRTAMDLCPHLTGLIRTASQKGVPVNLKRLYGDLWRWDDEPDVRVEWAQGYWGGMEVDV